ncbi:MAG: PDZ domain-containing protein [Gammaproteobacteria bacterium]|nr:PDZ domain-containing protein [Gammaproteobacteria bacterium]
MILSLPQPVEYYFHLKPQIRQTAFSVSLLKLMFVTAFLLSLSTSVSAFSSAEYVEQNDNIDTAEDTARHIDTDTDSALNLRVVKLEQTSPLAQTMEQIDAARLILVGESHTRWDHHLIQLEILKHLYQKSAKLAIGVEWFQQPYQKHLDAYIAGEISEQEMLHQTGYFERWRYDYRLYRPIIQYAHEHKIPVIALNASQELSHALSKSGFNDLPAELKEQLPESYDWSDKEYEQNLRNVFDEHPDYPGEFEDFLRGQLTWDESMAERSAQYLDENPETRLLVLAGSGHIMFGSGIPNRIKRRIDVEQVSILLSEDLLPVSEDIADFLVLSEQQTLEPVGLIGALLDTEGKLLVINGFSDDSAVKDAGLEKGAVILSVDNKTVETFADFRFAILGKTPGDSIELHYLENAEDDSKNRKSVTLELR